MWEEDGATNWYPQMGRLQRLRLLRMVDRTKGAWFLERGLMAVLTSVLMHACGQLGKFSPSIHLVRTITVEGSLFLELVITMEGSLVLTMEGSLFLPFVNVWTNYEPLIQTFSKGRKFSFTSLPLYS
jgi:hypothetical protein